VTPSVVRSPQMSECVYNPLSEINLATKVSGSDPDAYGGIALELH